MMSASTVDPEEIARFEAIAEEWWRPEGKFRPLHQMNPLRMQFIRDEVTARLRPAGGDETPLAGMRVLDIGCGGGLLSEPLTRLGADVTGIDASEKNIAIARCHAEKTRLSIEYRASTAEALHETHREAFDVVCALEIIEHVADVPVFMDAVTGVLRPGGVLCLSTINRTLKAYALAIVGAEMVMRWLPRGTHQWSKFLAPSEVAALMRERGVELAALQGLTYHPLRDTWALSPDVSVNYMLGGQKKQVPGD